MRGDWATVFPQKLALYTAALSLAGGTEIQETVYFCRLLRDHKFGKVPSFYLFGSQPCNLLESAVYPQDPLSVPRRGQHAYCRVFTEALIKAPSLSELCS